MKCAVCGLVLQPGELVTRGMPGISKAGIVCKFCRPFRPFYVPDTASTLRLLASNEAGHHIGITQVVYPDGSSALILRNRLGGSWEILVALDDAQQVAEGLVAAAIEMRERLDGEDPKAQPVTTCHICGSERKCRLGSDCPICTLNGDRGTMTIRSEQSLSL